MRDVHRGNLKAYLAEVKEEEVIALVAKSFRKTVEPTGIAIAEAEYWS